jgi:hypothetical protein
LIPDEEEYYFILFILEIDSLKKIIDFIIEGGGIILEGIIRIEGIIIDILLDDNNREILDIFSIEDRLKYLIYPGLS